MLELVNSALLLAWFISWGITEGTSSGLSIGLTVVVLNWPQLSILLFDEEECCRIGTFGRSYYPLAVCTYEKLL